MPSVINPTYPFNAPKAEEELTSFLNLLSVEEIQKFRGEILAGHIDGNVYLVYKSYGGCGCFIGKISEAHEVEIEEMYSLTDFSKAEWLDLEFAAKNVNGGETPDDNETLALVLTWVDEYLATSKETEDTFNEHNRL